MNIEKMTILVAASREYQKAELSMEISDFQDNDVEYIENLLVGEAIKTLDKVCEANSVRSNSAPVVQAQRVPNMGNAQRAPKPPREGSYNKGYAPKTSGPSEKQINILKKAGYSPDQIDLMTGKDAAKIIEEYWQRTNYQPKTTAPQYSQYPQQPMNNYQNYQYPDEGY